MVLDHLQNAQNYTSLHKSFEKAFAFLKKATDEQLPTGRYELEGDALFAMVQEYQTKTADQPPAFEAHRKYIDIQYVVSGREAVEVSTLASCKPTTVYDEARDVIFFEDHAAAVNCVWSAGDFGIFYPCDVHKPGQADQNVSCAVKKIVVKVKI